MGEGTRSGLWSECARLVGEIRPRYAIFENVTALLSGADGKWFERVLWDLSEVGYDAEWHCIPASELGAHHHRDRVWIICYPQHAGRASPEVRESDKTGNGSNQKGQESASELARPSDTEILVPYPRLPESQGRIPAKADNDRCGEAGIQQGSESPSPCNDVADTNSAQRKRNRSPIGILAEYADLGSASGWATEPELGRVANGIPDRSHRLKGLGNAVVPQIPELIGRAILEAENEAM